MPSPIEATRKLFNHATLKKTLSLSSEEMDEAVESVTANGFHYWVEPVGCYITLSEPESPSSYVGVVERRRPALEKCRPLIVIYR